MPYSDIYCHHKDQEACVRPLFELSQMKTSYSRNSGMRDRKIVQHKTALYDFEKKKYVSVYLSLYLPFIHDAVLLYLLFNLQKKDRNRCRRFDHNKKISLKGESV